MPVEKLEFSELERGVRMLRTLEAGPVPPFLLKDAGPVADHWSTSDFLVPGILLLTGELFRAGSVKAAGGGRPSDDQLLHRNFSCQAVTPRNDRSTTYFYAFGPWQRDAASAKIFANIGAKAFEEDRVMITAQQRVIDGSPGVRPRLLPMDQLAAKYGKIVRRLIEQQSPRPLAHHRGASNDEAAPHT